MAKKAAKKTEQHPQATLEALTEATVSLATLQGCLLRALQAGSQENRQLELEHARSHYYQAQAQLVETRKLAAADSKGSKDARDEPTA